MSIYGFPIDVSIPKPTTSQGPPSYMSNLHPTDLQLNEVFGESRPREHYEQYIDVLMLAEYYSKLSLKPSKNEIGIASTPKQTTSLDSLPVEMLSEIFQYCNNLDFDYKAMRRRIEDWGWKYRCPIGFFASNILLAFSLPRKKRTRTNFDLYSYEFRPTQCTKFIRTILERSELAEHVLSFDAMINCPRIAPTDTEVSVFNDTAVTNLRVALALVNGRIAPEHLEETGERRFVDFTQNSAVSIAMLLLPKLRYLSLSIHDCEPELVPGSRSPYRFIKKVIRKAVSDPTVPFLQQLETISVKPVNSDTSTRISYYELDIGPFSQMASIQKVVIKQFMLSESEKFKFRLPAVIDVELRLDQMHLDRLDRFLRCFPTLESFSYEQVRETSPMDTEDGYAANHIVQSLTTLKSSLRYLCLKPAKFRNYYKHASKEVQSLTTFECLEELDVIAFDVWVDISLSYNGDEMTVDTRITPMVDLVPSSLKKLTLRQASSKTLLHVSVLLQERERNNGVPNLAFLRIVLDTHYQSFDMTPDIDILQGMANNCGITLKVEVHVESTGPIANIKRNIRRGYGFQKKNGCMRGIMRLTWEHSLEIHQLARRGWQ